jgi:hypothetical protein
MATELGTYTSLRTIVSYSLDELMKSSGDEDMLWILGLRGYTMITRDFAGQPRTVRLPVLGNKTVPFPAGCLSWSKIGLLDNEGQINTLRINTALTTFRDNNPNRLSNLTPDINDSIGEVALVPYYSNYYYGGSVYQLYGVGNGVITYGECNVDEENRVVMLPPHFKYDAIMFEYISLPETDSDYQVPTNLQEAIIAFIKWKLKLISRQEFYAECTAARRIMPKKKVILQTLNQVIRESDGFKLKS